jgi:hypothetical protein
MGESIISTCMGFPGKTKDGEKPPSLELKVNGGKSRTSFCLKPQYRKEVMQWMKGFKFPDGYDAGLRRSVNMAIGKLIGLKSHDYYIIMELF